MLILFSLDKAESFGSENTETARAVWTLLAQMK